MYTVCASIPALYEQAQTLNVLRLAQRHLLIRNRLIVTLQKDSIKGNL